MSSVRDPFAKATVDLVKFQSRQLKSGWEKEQDVCDVDSSTGKRGAFYAAAFFAVFRKHRLNLTLPILKAPASTGAFLCFE